MSRDDLNQDANRPWRDFGDEVFALDYWRETCYDALANPGDPDDPDDPEGTFHEEAACSECGLEPTEQPLVFLTARETLDEGFVIGFQVVCQFCARKSNTTGEPITIRFDRFGWEPHLKLRDVVYQMFMRNPVWCEGCDYKEIAPGAGRLMVAVHVPEELDTSDRANSGVFYYHVGCEVDREFFMVYDNGGSGFEEETGKYDPLALVMKPGKCPHGVWMAPGDTVAWGCSLCKPLKGTSQREDRFVTPRARGDDLIPRGKMRPDAGNARAVRSWESRERNDPNASWDDVSRRVARDFADTPQFHGLPFLEKSVVLAWGFGGQSRSDIARSAGKTGNTAWVDEIINEYAHPPDYTAAELEATINKGPEPTEDEWVKGFLEVAECRSGRLYADKVRKMSRADQLKEAEKRRSQGWRF